MRKTQQTDFALNHLPYLLEKKGMQGGKAVYTRQQLKQQQKYITPAFAFSLVYAYSQVTIREKEKYADQEFLNTFFLTGTNKNLIKKDYMSKQKINLHEKKFSEIVQYEKVLNYANKIKLLPDLQFLIFRGAAAVDNQKFFYSQIKFTYLHLFLKHPQFQIALNNSQKTTKKIYTYAKDQLFNQHQKYLEGTQDLSTYKNFIKKQLDKLDQQYQASLATTKYQMYEERKKQINNYSLSDVFVELQEKYPSQYPNPSGSTLRTLKDENGINRTVDENKPYSLETLPKSYLLLLSLLHNLKHQNIPLSVAASGSAVPSSHQSTTKDFEEKRFYLIDLLFKQIDKILYFQKQIKYYNKYQFFQIFAASFGFLHLNQKAQYIMDLSLFYYDNFQNQKIVYTRQGNTVVQEVSKKQDTIQKWLNKQIIEKGQELTRTSISIGKQLKILLYQYDISSIFNKNANQSIENQYSVDELPEIIPKKYNNLDRFKKPFKIDKTNSDSLSSHIIQFYQPYYRSHLKEIGMNKKQYIKKKNDVQEKIQQVLQDYGIKILPRELVLMIAQNSNPQQLTYYYSPINKINKNNTNKILDALIDTALEKYYGIKEQVAYKKYKKNQSGPMQEKEKNQFLEPKPSWQDNYNQYRANTKIIIDNNIAFIMKMMNFKLDALNQKNVLTDLMKGNEKIYIAFLKLYKSIYDETYKVTSTEFDEFFDIIQNFLQLESDNNGIDNLRNILKLCMQIQLGQDYSLITFMKKQFAVDPAKINPWLEYTTNSKLIKHHFFQKQRGNLDKKEDYKLAPITFYRHEQYYFKIPIHILFEKIIKQCKLSKKDKNRLQTLIYTFRGEFKDWFNCLNREIVIKTGIKSNKTQQTNLQKFSMFIINQFQRNLVQRDFYFMDTHPNFDFLMYFDLEIVQLYRHFNEDVLPNKFWESSTPPNYENYVKKTKDIIILLQLLETDENYDYIAKFWPKNGDHISQRGIDEDYVPQSIINEKQVVQSLRKSLKIQISDLIKYYGFFLKKAISLSGFNFETKQEGAQEGAQQTNKIPKNKIQNKIKSNKRDIRDDLLKMILSGFKEHTPEMKKVKTIRKIIEKLCNCTQCIGKMETPNFHTIIDIMKDLLRPNVIIDKDKVKYIKLLINILISVNVFINLPKVLLIKPKTTSDPLLKETMLALNWLFEFILSPSQGKQNNQQKKDYKFDDQSQLFDLIELDLSEGVQAFSEEIQNGMIVVNQQREQQRMRGRANGRNNQDNEETKFNFSFLATMITQYKIDNPNKDFTKLNFIAMLLPLLDGEIDINQVNSGKNNIFSLLKEKLEEKVNVKAMDQSIVDKKSKFDNLKKAFEAFESLTKKKNPIPLINLMINKKDMSPKTKQRIECITSILEIQNLPTRKQQVRKAFNTAKKIFETTFETTRGDAQQKIKTVLIKILEIIQKLAVYFLSKKVESPSIEEATNAAKNINSDQIQKTKEAAIEKLKNEVENMKKITFQQILQKIRDLGESDLMTFFGLANNADSNQGGNSIATDLQLIADTFQTIMSLYEIFKNSPDNLSVIEQQLIKVITLIRAIMPPTLLNNPQFKPFIDFILNEKMIKAIFALLNKNFSSNDINYLFTKFLNKEQMQQFTTIKSIASKLLNIETISISDLKKLITSQSSNSTAPKSITDMTNAELFAFIDGECGNSNGLIDTYEFMNLCSQLGISLTESKVVEIFASVKVKAVSNTPGLKPDELNQPEFDIAMREVQKIKMLKMLVCIGINEKNLNRYIAFFIMILVLVVGFLLIGIRAFAMGGTFSTIINSLLPVGSLYLLFFQIFRNGCDSQQDLN